MATGLTLNTKILLVHGTNHDIKYFLRLDICFMLRMFVLLMTLCQL
jgi:hypothetical protein